MRTVIVILGAVACANGDATDTDTTGATADTGTPSTQADADADGVPASEDCDDTDPKVGAGTTTYADVDQDGYGDPKTALVECDPSTDRVTDGGDCDDAHAEASPAGTEICDGLDNDCDTSTPEAGMVHRTALDGTVSDETAVWTAGADGAPAALSLDAPATWDLCDVHVFVALTIEADVTLRGHGATTLDGGGVSRTLSSVGTRGSQQVPGQVVSLSGLTVRGGAEASGSCGLVSRTALVLDDVTFTDCVTTTSTGAGGALFLDRSQITATGGAFVDNGARRGGAINATSAIGNFTGTQFSNNGPVHHGKAASLVGEGGAMRWAGESLVLDSVQFLDHASDRGGAVFTTSVAVTATNTTWERNSATSSGGALWISDTSVIIDGGHFLSSDAGTEGGAIYMETSALVGVGALELHENTAGTHGGAVYSRTDTSSVDLDGASLVDNEAGADGGALFLDDDPATTLADSTFEGNTAVRGGALYYSGGVLTMSGNAWTDNTATTGGALYTEAPGAGIVDATKEDFSGNTPFDHRHEPGAVDFDWGLAASFRCSNKLDGCK